MRWSHAGVLIAAAVLAGSPSAVAQADAASLPAILSTAAAYVDAFERDFSHIIGAEDDEQSVQTGAKIRTRNLQSEVFFVRLDEARAWVTVRNVLKVDGRPVRGSHDRIMDALNGTAPGQIARLRALADEGARYNIGTLHRNFSDPTLALTFLGAAVQSRFAFTIAGADSVDGVPVRQLRFEERVQPTLIRDGTTGASLPSHGILSVADDGSVRRTELDVDVDGSTTATIRVRFAPDPKLNLLVPELMEEDYRVGAPGRESSISCKAVYSDFRRFETSIRIVD